ncbi:hypothetical protein QFC22_002418 [Naganishia vaughanmartiniae]|uniref:Uncharacterized protein n=1 Tax=Naganishia vaughanmartiniae TaxID=1424756 RepID=A0ACC2XCN5_9TREE|nr:hypothetical protein QFC22_002418 [Naganishia vaughanmartiniae]
MQTVTQQAVKNRKELNELMSKKGDEVTGRKGLAGYTQRLKAYRRQPWPFYTKWKEITEDIRDESSVPRGSLSKRYFDPKTNESIDELIARFDENNSGSDEEHSDASQHERQKKRKTDKMSGQLIDVKDALQQAVKSNETLNDLRRESLKMERASEHRVAVDLLSAMPEFLHALPGQQRFMIKYIREEDNMLDFMAYGPVLRENWIEEALGVMEERETEAESQSTQLARASRVTTSLGLV